MTSHPTHPQVTVLVLDGFGIGAMPDAGELRPHDLHADTLQSVLDTSRAAGTPLRLDTLGALGLGAVHPHPDLPAEATLPGAAGSAALGYPGADTFAGHQTMMGADVSHIAVARLAERLDDVDAALQQAGHTVSQPTPGRMLLVDDAVLVHDNLEADPGINWNASGRLEDAAFPHTLAVARVVRQVAPVARVIAVSGHAAHPLTRYVREGDDHTVGLDTPATGFYRNGDLQVQHLGAQLDHTRQLPELAARAGLPVTLIGKAADILRADGVTRRPAVPTADVLAHTRDAAAGPAGLVVANVQETDLAGHQQDPARYAALLRQVDAGIAELLSRSRPGDLLIVTADHGNDPAVGHSHHTREYVPVLIHQAGGAHTRMLPRAATLADVGATAAAALGLPQDSLRTGTPLPLRQAG